MVYLLLVLFAPFAQKASGLLTGLHALVHAHELDAVVLRELMWLLSQPVRRRFFKGRAGR
jgi:hypothetical protein